MNSAIDFKVLLTNTNSVTTNPLALFAVINLGVIELIAKGRMTPSEAERLVYEADNILFVHRHLNDQTADGIMSHGVQLADLFDVLPQDQAERALQRELQRMHTLCLNLLDQERVAA